MSSLQALVGLIMVAMPQDPLHGSSILPGALEHVKSWTWCGEQQRFWIFWNIDTDFKSDVPLRSESGNFIRVKWIKWIKWVRWIKWVWSTWPEIRRANGSSGSSGFDPADQVDQAGPMYYAFSLVTSNCNVGVLVRLSMNLLHDWVRCVKTVRWVKWIKWIKWVTWQWGAWSQRRVATLRKGAWSKRRVVMKHIPHWEEQRDKKEWL